MLEKLSKIIAKAVLRHCFIELDHKIVSHVIAFMLSLPFCKSLEIYSTID